MIDLDAVVANYVGAASAPKIAGDPVERGAVRRFSQAVMDFDPAYAEHTLRYGEPIAPPLLPQNAFRRDFGEADPLERSMTDPDFDGAVGAIGGELPEIEEFRGYGVLNGGSEIELYRYAYHGERIRVVSRYDSITRKESKKGPLYVIVIASEYSTEAGELLLRVRRTTLRREL